jgi:hypothetical protein
MTVWEERRSMVRLGYLATMVVVALGSGVTTSHAASSAFTDRPSGMEATVVGMRLDLHGSQSVHPPAGRYWLEVHVRLVNHSHHAEKTRGRADFTVLSTASGVVPATASRVNLSYLRAQAIQSGGAQEGWVLFAVPNALRRGYVMWSDDARLDPAASIGRFRF